MAQLENSTEIPNIPIFCLPNRKKTIDNNYLLDFHPEHNLMQEHFENLALLESLCYDNELSLNLKEFLLSEVDHVKFSVDASRICNEISLINEDNIKEDIRITKAHNWETQINSEKRSMTKPLQNIPKNLTSKYIEVDAEIYHTEKSTYYIIDQKIFFHLRNWHCINTTTSGTFCILCHINIDAKLESLKIHIEEKKHLEKIEVMKKNILAEFGHSIVTETSSNKYHCGVCVVEFSRLNQIRTHCKGKQHLKSLQSRINRAERFLASLGKNNFSNPGTSKDVNRDEVVLQEENSSHHGEKIYQNIIDLNEPTSLGKNNFSNPATGNVLQEDNTSPYVENIQQNIIDLHEPSESTNETISKNPCERYMEVNMERIGAAFIINRRVALLRRNWNTLAGTKSALFCVICNKNVKNTLHMDDLAHTELLKLRGNNILEEFGYSIVMETAKKNFYHCGVCNAIIHTLPGMRHHCQSAGHLEDYERLTKRAQKFLSEATTLCQEKENDPTYTDEEEPTNEPHESCDLSQKYMTIYSVKKDHASFFINNKIVLVRAKWHGLLRNNGEYYCVLCQKYSFDMPSHMADGGHRQRMLVKVRSVLAEFGYGMVCETPEKDKYHCGVCNVTIQGISEVRAHCVRRIHLQRIDKHIEMANKILCRVPRKNYRSDCALRKGTFYD